ncbi:uncharacterized protein LOC132563310 [Ylistrum balloti]|uniref:uncharacterized protein LOC132563310 n=1 Tax=Ylistrum balloti TaxID=509963 RepID=UPI002905AE23|nr:uncharacterized protein LOC132563310 [Ylistrum balloti]
MSETKACYGLWDLPKLKRELRARGARISGRKNELIERLEAYDRNNDFGREELEPEFCMNVPSLECYNNDTVFTEFRLEAIESYLLQMQKTVDNKNGCVLEGQCECAAGMGPQAHCKHVCAVLYACYKFSIFKELLTEETCTKKLQTFHKSKPYYGSPIKAQNLPFANENLTVNYDPRPQQYRNVTSYSDHFRSVWLNHTKVNVYPVSQIFKPANPYALDSDHDYSEIKISDKWLQDMCITKINNDQIKEIEHNTRGQTANKNTFIQLWESL